MTSYLPLHDCRQQARKGLQLDTEGPKRRPEMWYNMQQDGRAAFLRAAEIAQGAFHHLERAGAADVPQGSGTLHRASVAIWEHQAAIRNPDLTLPSHADLALPLLQGDMPCTAALLVPLQLAAVLLPLRTVMGRELSPVAVALLHPLPAILQSYWGMRENMKKTLIMSYQPEQVLVVCRSGHCHDGTSH